MEVLLIGNDQTIKVLGLKDEVSGDFINGLTTVTARVKNKDGSSVAGENWPITLEYVTDSDGDYQGNLDDALKLVNNRLYTVEISVDGGGGLKALWHFDRVAQYRQPE